MNEINETFTKQINGFECSIGSRIFKEQQPYNTVLFCVTHKISKNNKFVQFIFESDGDFGLYTSKYDISYGEKDNALISNVFLIPEETEKLFSKIFNRTIYDEDKNIWQILQDEWHKRFEDE